jgi:hypothetical protein
VIAGSAPRRPARDAARSTIKLFGPGVTAAIVTRPATPISALMT